VATRGDGVFTGLEQITSSPWRRYRADSRTRGEIIMLLHDETSGIADAIRGLAESPRATRGMRWRSRPRHARATKEERSPPAPVVVGGGSPFGGARRRRAASSSRGPVAAQAQAAHALVRAPEGWGSGGFRSLRMVSPAALTCATVVAFFAGGDRFSMSGGSLWGRAESRGRAQVRAPLLALTIHRCDHGVRMSSSRGCSPPRRACAARSMRRGSWPWCAFFLGLEGGATCDFGGLGRAARRATSGVRDALECFSFVVEARRNAPASHHECGTSDVFVQKHRQKERLRKSLLQAAVVGNIAQGRTEWKGLGATEQRARAGARVNREWYGHFSFTTFDCQPGACYCPADLEGFDGRKATITVHGAFPRPERARFWLRHCGEVRLSSSLAAAEWQM